MYYFKFDCFELFLVFLCAMSLFNNYIIRLSFFCFSHCNALEATIYCNGKNYSQCDDTRVSFSMHRCSWIVTMVLVDFFSSGIRVEPRKSLWNLVCYLKCTRVNLLWCQMDFFFLILLYLFLYLTLLKKVYLYRKYGIAFLVADFCQEFLALSGLL